MSDFYSQTMHSFSFRKKFNRKYGFFTVFSGFFFLVMTCVERSPILWFISFLSVLVDIIVELIDGIKYSLECNYNSIRHLLDKSIGYEFVFLDLTVICIIFPWKLIPTNIDETTVYSGIIIALGERMFMAFEGNPYPHLHPNKCI